MVKARPAVEYDKLVESRYGDPHLSLHGSLVFSVVACIFSAGSLISDYVV